MSATTTRSTSKSQRRLAAALLASLAACTQAPPRPATDTPPAAPPAAAFLTGAGASASLSAGDLRRSGVIDFTITCRPAVQGDFEIAVALLHSFFYDEARRRFEQIAHRDPGCAMAHWGIAMTWYHPLWAPPTAAERARGLAAAQRAAAIGGRTELERGLIAAILTFYTTNEIPALANAGSVIAGCSCCGPQAHGARAHAFHDKLAALHRRFPKHVEVTVFYALAMLGTVVPTDKTYARQRAAAALLEPLFEQHPDHPGIAHYIIHAYDYPELAERALLAARRYDDIAPWVPHALHMPTHIYTRLGMWQDSIAGNVASSLAARDHAARHYGGDTTMDDLHAMDYLMFAFLQTGQDQRARQLLADLGRIERIVPGNGFASAYAATAIPARYALERDDFATAARLQLPLPEFVTRFPMAVAHTAFANAVGAARSGDAAAAARAVARLRQLREKLAGSRLNFWTDQVRIQELAAAGWLAHAGGDDAEAQRLLEEAARIEDAAGTHPVTPGQILPAREQLGDLLRGRGQAAAAFAQYERSLRSFPRRFRSHAGAMVAARAAGDRTAARRHAESLLAMAGSSGHRPEMLHTAREITAAPR